MRVKNLVLLTALVVGLGCGTDHAATPSTTGGTKVLVNTDRDGLAVQGYDVVAYFTEGKAVKGDPSHKASYGGAVYQFVSHEHHVMFEADPQKYVPQFGGYCAYAASIDKVSPIDPEFWEIVDGRLLLQHNQKAWDLWHKDASGNLVKADKNWPGLVAKNGR